MYKQYFKRFFDITFALILLILLSPIMLILTLLIKLDSKGPVLFKQIRSGKNNKEFMLYKFRSMTYNNDFYDKTKEDQITKVGKIIRKTSLDELPQIINILKGEMSFIGPRPWVVDYAKYFTAYQMKRLDVLPGITGLAQAKGRNAIAILDRINLDVEYVENMSLLLDIKIIFKTIVGIIKKEGFSNNKAAIHNELKVLKKQYNIYKKGIEEEHKIQTRKRKNNKNKESDIALVGSGA